MVNGPDNFQPDPPPTGPRWEEAGGAQIPPALIALRRPLPELLFVLYDPRRRAYCYRKVEATEDCGLLCFADPERAREYARTWLPPRTYDHVWGVWLDQAHAMARARHAAVNCLLLIDEAWRPHVHHVK